MREERNGTALRSPLPVNGGSYAFIGNTEILDFQWIMSGVFPETIRIHYFKPVYAPKGNVPIA